MRFLFIFLIICPLVQGQVKRGEIINNTIEKEKIGDYHAIIISVNEYEDDRYSDLKEPQKDADKLYKILTQKYNFKPKNISKLEDATYEQTIEALDNKQAELLEKDNLLIFYAGHGYWDKNLESGFLIPSDAKQHTRGKWLSNDRLKNYIKSMKSKHVLLISDACYAGGLFRGREEMDKGLKRDNSLKSRRAITSGSMELVPDKSVLMKYVLSKLEKNKEQFLSTYDLFSSIRTTIKNNSDNQPRYSVLHKTGDEGGEFIFYNAKFINYETNINETEFNYTESDLDIITNRITNRNLSLPEEELAKLELKEKKKAFFLPPPYPAIGYYNYSKKHPNFLSLSQSEKINEKLLRIEKDLAVEIVVVVVDDLAGYETISYYATELGNTWRVGKGEWNDGIVVLIKLSNFKGESEVFIARESSLSLELSEKTLYNIINNELIPRFKKKVYFKGIWNAINKISNQIDGSERD